MVTNEQAPYGAASMREAAELLLLWNKEMHERNPMAVTAVDVWLAHAATRRALSTRLASGKAVCEACKGTGALPPTHDWPYVNICTDCNGTGLAPSDKGE